MQKKKPHKIIMGRYIDPLSDFGFKLFFGNEPNKDLLIAFLNELFHGRKSIVDLTGHNTLVQAMDFSPRL